MERICFGFDNIQAALYSANLDGSSAMEILDLNTLGSGFFCSSWDYNKWYESVLG